MATNAAPSRPRASARISPSGSPVSGSPPAPAAGRTVTGGVAVAASTCGAGVAGAGAGDGTGGGVSASTTAGGVGVLWEDAPAGAGVGVAPPPPPEDGALVDVGALVGTAVEVGPLPPPPGVLVAVAVERWSHRQRSRRSRRERRGRRKRCRGRECGRRRGGRGSRDLGVKILEFGCAWSQGDDDASVVEQLLIGAAGRPAIAGRGPCLRIQVNPRRTA